MVDRIDSYEPNGALRARKLTSTGEDYWRPLGDGFVMPDGVVLESLLQAAGLLVVLSSDSPRHVALPTSVQRVTVRGRVERGDVLTLDVRMERFDAETATFSGGVSVRDRAILDIAGALFVVMPLEVIADPADWLTRLARMQRHPSDDSRVALGGDRLSLLEPS